MQLAAVGRVTPALVATLTLLIVACSDAVGPDATSGPDAAGAKGGAKKQPTAPEPAPAPAPPGTANPLVGMSLYVNPASRAAQQASAWRESRPADAAQMDKIAAHPSARWFGNWNADVRADVDLAVSVASAAGAVPVLVAYNIPQRDCGSYSAGGSSSAASYRSWISAFAAGIGSRRAIVILEPDALAGMGCLSAADQSARAALIRNAVATLRANSSTAVYVDAGHSHWQSASTMAVRLTDAGVADANGFALNVSNFYLTPEQAAYGDAVSALVGGKHYVIDTSRNGLGSAGDSQWCNPEGRALGERPTTATGRPFADAYLWVKIVGESDGSCQGYPASGTWMPEYALGLAQRAAY